MKNPPLVNDEITSQFRSSLLSLDSIDGSVTDILNWMKDQNRMTKTSIHRVPLVELRGWAFTEDRSSLRHQSGRFFSIDALGVFTDWGPVRDWEQPILNQAEIGFIGFLVKSFNGILHFLAQAKVEPGNVNTVQLSPTLQATRSNYLRIHGGLAPSFLDHFKNARSEHTLIDQLQSEQGSRFLKKRNRNIIIQVDDDLQRPDNFRWVTLGQIKALLKYDNVVNMDTRSVIACIHFGTEPFRVAAQPEERSKREMVEAIRKSATNHTTFQSSLDEIHSKIARLKSIYTANVSSRPLHALKHWKIDSTEIRHKDHLFFKIIGVDVSIENREIAEWMQPMVESCRKGLFAFIAKELEGVLHFAVQIKWECGNLDAFEFGPTVQDLDGGPTVGSTIDEGFFKNQVMETESDRILYDSLQSEEGGRFFREQNRYMIVMADESFPNELPENFVWMTLHQIFSFLRFNNQFNIQARSLIASLPFN